MCRWVIFAQQLAELLIPRFFIRLQIPIPCSQFTSGQRHFESFAFLPQMALHSMNFGNVRCDPDKTCDFTGIISNGHQHQVNAEVRTIFADPRPVVFAETSTLHFIDKYFSSINFGAIELLKSLSIQFNL